MFLGKKSLYYFMITLKLELGRVSPGAAVKLCLGDLLVMGSNPEPPSPIPSHSEEPLSNGVRSFFFKFELSSLVYMIVFIKCEK